jgi:intracellular sulfur oxidation DsrE/DsrF family protein
MQRRSFLSRFPALAALVGAGAATPAAASGLAPENGRFEPVKHPQDDWLDSLPGKHRVVFDTWTASKFPDVLRFANNIFRGNKDGYELSEKEVAIVIVARHGSAPFAFNDAMWAKYGKHFSERMEFLDPKTSKPPTANVYSAQLGGLLKQGVHLAVCNLTTRSTAQRLAEVNGEKVDDVYKEITANALPNAHFVAAGVVGATRAQERGYALISIG